MTNSDEDGARPGDESAGEPTAASAGEKSLDEDPWDGSREPNAPAAAEWAEREEPADGGAVPQTRPGSSPPWWPTAHGDPTDPEVAWTVGPAESEYVPERDYHLSPLTMITAPVRYLRNFLIPLFVVLIWGTTNPWALTSAILVTLAFVISGLVTYQTFRYRIGAERLEIRQGLISRSRRTIPLERIRGVDVTSTLLHRTLGLAVVKIEAAAGGGESEEGKLDAVSRREAERLRQVLLRRKEELRDRDGSETEKVAGDTTSRGHGAATVAGTAEPSEVVITASTSANESVAAGGEPDQTYFAMPTRWYLYGAVNLGYLLTPFVALAALLGAVGQAIGQVEIDIRREDAEGVLEWLTQLVSLPLVWIVIGVGVVLAVLMPVFAVVAYAINHWAFTLRQREQSLVAERGLFTRHSVTLERRRIRGYEVVDTPLERLVRAVQLRAIVTGLGDVSARAILLPLGGRRKVADIVDRALGAFESTLRPHPRAALARRMFRAVGPGVAIAVVAAVTQYPIVAAVAMSLALLGVPLGWDRYRALGHGYDGDNVSVRSGSLRRRQAVVHRQAIIGWRWTQTIFQRRVGLTTLIATVGAGTGGYSAVDAETGESVDFADGISPAMVRPFIEGEPAGGERHPTG